MIVNHTTSHADFDCIVEACGGVEDVRSHAFTPCVLLRLPMGATREMHVCRACGKVLAFERSDAAGSLLTFLVTPRSLCTPSRKHKPNAYAEDLLRGERLDDVVEAYRVE